MLRVFCVEVVVGAGIDPVEDRDLIDRQRVAGVEVLLESRHRAKVLEFIPDGVLVFLPSLGVGVLVDVASRFVDVGLCLSRVVESQRLGEVVTQLVVAAPVPLSREGRAM